jgi:hypothetical protein
VARYSDSPIFAGPILFIIHIYQFDARRRDSRIISEHIMDGKPKNARK